MSEFLPYGRQWIDEEDIAAVTAVLRSDYLTTGPAVEAFEAKLAETVGAKHAVAVSNGTAALHLAALALLQPGQKVLTTPNTFVATANAIVLAGAEPIFVDIGSDGNIDLDLAEERLRADPEIRGLFAVHFSGRMADQERLKTLRQRYGIVVVEDCAHSLGAAFAMADGTETRAGGCAFSDACTFSFHPVKTVTTGEGGAITTNDDVLAQRLRRLRSHGIVREPSAFRDKDRGFDEQGTPNPWYYEMQELGLNYRLSDLQAALGSSQLGKLERFLERRRELARLYEERLPDSIRPLYPHDPRSAYHLYVVRVPFAKIGRSRAELFSEMRQNGIGLQLHYLPIHRQPYYRQRGRGGEKTPGMDRYADEAVSLPLFPAMEEEDVDRVARGLQTFLKR